MQAEAAFRQELESAGLCPPEIIPDGKLHRVPVQGKPGAKDGAYVLHEDAPASGWFQNHRTGQQGTWTAGHDHQLTEVERSRLAERMETDRRQREAAQAEAWAEAARRAQAELAQAKPCTSHPYLERKGVKPCAGLKVGQAGRLLVPMLGPDGKAQSRQRIGPDGQKRFLTGSKKAGGYFPVKGNNTGPLLVCEGLATGLTLHEATGQTVLVAFDCGNLEAVARMAREKYPERAIILAGDDDHATEGNPGRTKALAAALAVGGKLALPVFAHAGAGTDFNDLHQAEGLEVVKGQVEWAQKPEADQQEQSQTKAEGPLPLMRPVPEAEPYPVGALGSTLEAAARCLAETIQAPLGLCAQSVLAAAALAVQGQADVELDGRVFPPSLFVLTVAASGERKSAVDSVATAPHRAHERALAETYRREYVDYQKALEAWQEEKKVALRVKDYNERLERLRVLPEPEAPLTPVMISGDPTYEGLVKLLERGQPSQGLFTDEGGRFIGGHAMNAENQLRTATGLSNLWGGGAIDRVRAGDGAIKLYGRRLSMHLMTQPGVAQSLLSNGVLDDQGLLSRLLPCWPQSTAGARRYRPVDPNTTPAAIAYGQRLARILSRPLPVNPEVKNELAPRRLGICPQGKALFAKFHDEVEAALADGQELAPIRAFANKSAEHAARLAAVLQLVEDLDAPSISAANMASGVRLAQFYIAETLRLHHAGLVDQDLILAQRLLDWLRSRVGQPVYLIDIYQRGPNSVRDKATAGRLLKILVEHNCLKPSGPAEVDGKLRNETWRLVEA